MAKASHPWVRGVVDYGGLIAFAAAFFLKARFVASDNALGWTLAIGGAGQRDITAATWWLVGVSGVALLVGLAVERRLALLPLISGLFALVFGTLTLVFHDPVFIKIKPTIANLLFGTTLLLGLAFRRNLLKLLLGEALTMPPQAWRTLTIRYVAFFFFAAVLNEAVWRTQADDVWVLFRFPGLFLLTVLFSLCQVPLMMKHMREPEPPPPPID